MAEVPTVVQWVKILVLSLQWLRSLLRHDLTPGQYNGLRIQCCCSCGVDCSCGLDLISGLGTSICYGCSQKKKKKKKKERKKERKRKETVKFRQ